MRKVSASNGTSFHFMLEKLVLLQRFPWTNSRVEFSSKENVSSFLLRFAPIFDRAVETATPCGITFKVWQRSHFHPLGPRPAVVKFRHEAVFRLFQWLEKLYGVHTLVSKGLCIRGMGCVCVCV